MQVGVIFMHSYAVIIDVGLTQGVRMYEANANELNICGCFWKVCKVGRGGVKGKNCFAIIVASKDKCFVTMFNRVSLRMQTSWSLLFVIAAVR